eukprot:1363228-Amphidinium_carterae.2
MAEVEPHPFLLEGEHLPVHLRKEARASGRRNRRTRGAMELSPSWGTAAQGSPCGTDVDDDGDPVPRNEVSPPLPMEQR